MGNKDHTLKAKVVTGMVWKFAERIGARLVTFLISLLLARLLAPEDYGLVALITVFVTLADIIITTGFGSSLVQQKHADNLDFSSVFFLCSAFGVLMYLLIFLTAPFIASFYSDDFLIPLLRVTGLRLLFAGIGTAQNAFIDRNMLFKRYFYSSIAANLVSGLIALAMAFIGFGVWALVAQSLIQLAVSTLVLWFTVKWRPILAFSLARMKSLYSFGWKLLASSLIISFYNELRQLIINRLYSSADSGYYSKAQSFPALVNDNLTTTINSVLFPAISKEQSNRDKVRSMTRRSIKTTAYLVMPLMAGLAAIAEPLVLFLLTDKWSASIPYLQIACYVGAFSPVQTANLQAIKALGRSDTLLKMDILKRALGIGILVLVMRHGVMAIALSSMWNTTMFLIINMSPNIKLLNYSIKEQFVDIMPYIGMSVAMAAIVYPIQFLSLPLLAILALQVVAGGLLYLGMTLLFKIDSFYYILDIVKPLFRSKLKNGAGQKGE